MQNLKSNNEMMERLLNQVQRLQAQNKQLCVKLKKAEGSVEVSHLKSKQTKQKTKDDAGKLTKINRELKQKVDSLTRSIKQKDIEIQNMTERLNLKLNIDDKERQQVIENFRKFQGRKPNSTQDHKTMELIQYYEIQLQKKDFKITQLEQQLSNNIDLTLTLKKQLIAKDKQNQSTNSNLLQSTKMIHYQLDKAKTQLDVNKLNKELDRRTIMVDKLRGQLKQMRGKYEDLTREYYQIYNQLEENQKVIKRKVGKSITQQENQQNECPRPTIVPEKKGRQKQRPEQDIETNNFQHKQIIDKLLRIYNVGRPEDIVCSAIAADMALKNMPKMESYLTMMSSFLQKTLKTRIKFVDLQKHLSSLQSLLQDSVLTRQMLRNIFNQLSLNETSYVETIRQLKKNNQQYLGSLKRVKYVRELTVCKQIQQFIQFFSLDPEEPLNGQIVDLYEQLKALKKFIVLCNKLLGRDDEPHKCMQYVIQVLEKVESNQQQLKFKKNNDALQNSSSKFRSK